MRPIPSIITAALVALLVVFLIPSHSTQSQIKETAAERVLRTGILRCGYTAWDPILKVNPNTKEISGLAYDAIEATAKYLGVRVEWTEELGWGDFTQALKNGRVDAFCAGGTPSAERATATLGTIPFMFTEFVMAIRTNDNRFDTDPEVLNQPTTRIGQVDGTTGLKIVKTRFPSAHFITYPEMTPYSQLPLEVANNKTDATLIPASVVALYNKQHPNTLRAVPSRNTKRMLPNIFFVGENEWRLRELLNSGLTDVLDTGIIDKSIQRHQPVPNAYVLPDKPYQQ